MEHYYTYLKDFKFKSNITDYERFLLTNGNQGQAENHLIKNSDRITRLIGFGPWIVKDKVDFQKIRNNTFWIKQRLENIGFTNDNKESFYTKFTIPKASGGVRTIEAPNEELKDIQRTIVYLLKHTLYILEHNNAHAYVEKKGTHTNAEYHRKSNHFAKVDFSNFFPGISPLFINEILPKIGFFSAIFTDEHRDTMEEFLQLIIHVGTLRGGLPQGAVTSPYLSNLVMIPFDYHMIEYLRKEHPNIIYTRYADDITFSSYYAFADRKEDAQKVVEGIVQKIIDKHYTLNLGTMLKINPKKTRISTKFGKNRVTGIKINKDNELSIGYKEKRELKQNLASLIIRKKQEEQISSDEISEILGMHAYLHSIEPDYADYIESRLLQKFNINHRSIRDFLRK